MATRLFLRLSWVLYFGGFLLMFEDAIEVEEPEPYDLEIIEKLEILYTICGMAQSVDEDGNVTGTPDLTAAYEYIILEGGRGGGKSETVAQVLILLSRVVKTRILCTREIQKTMKDSVYRMLTDWIRDMGLQSEFIITKDSIVNKHTGTDFIFMGMEAATRSDNLKSLKGVSIVWYEEAQTATMESLEKLDPTIRMDGRKIIFTMNPRTDKDAVTVYLKDHPKALRIVINYPDNPFLPKVLFDQAIRMLETNPDRYHHIWMGKPVPEDSSSIILPYSWLVQCVDLHKKKHCGYIENLDDFRKLGGFDVADGMLDHHDKNALAVRQGPVITHCEEWQIDEVYKSVKRINSRYKTLGFNALYYDATALGTAAKSEFARLEDPNEGNRKLGYRVYAFKGAMKPYGKDKTFIGEGKQKVTNAAFFRNAKAQSWWNLRLRLENSMRLLRGEKIDRPDYYLSFSSDIKNLDSIFTELAQATFEEDNSGKIKVDKAPGVRTIVIEGKDKERKSPNKADGIIYSFAGDLVKGLKAHRAGTKKAEVIG